MMKGDNVAIMFIKAHYPEHIDTTKQPSFIALRGK
jgi:hypothetical protein